MGQVGDLLGGAIAGFSRRFHAAALATGPAHHVASPLGAWIVLALAADVLEGPERSEAASVLGMEVDAAVAAADALLTDPHPAVAAAVACWTAEAAIGPRLTAWAERLPARTERGPVPSPAAADRWASDRTGGLVERFPVAVDARTVLVLASALATRVTWAAPFLAVPATELGGPWATELTGALQRTGATWLADTEAAGRVVATLAVAREDVAVLTVGADPAVAPVDVLAAAHDLATDLDAGRLSLFDVPLGPGHSWELTEVVDERPSHQERVEVARVVLPAWRAESDHRLLGDDRFGFTDVVAHVLAALPPNPAGWEADAAQAAVAAYGRLGFEAAAVTAMGARAGSALPPVRRVATRTLAARLAHPHAAVALAAQQDQGRVPEGTGPWDALPVFSAWIAQPTDPWD